MSKPVQYNAEKLRKYLQNQGVATIKELKSVLGTDTDLTVFRKLKELSYHSSYSHRGRYYTLDEIARFDDLGLWSYNSARFSKYGTLKDTIEILVETSVAGYFSYELTSILKVSVKDALHKLFTERRIHREKISSRWLYCSGDLHHRQKQLDSRHDEEDGPRADFLPDELKAAIVLFFSLLDEKTRRLYAGLESLKWGHGGDRRISNLLGIDEKTVARGRRELLDGDLDHDRIRKQGGGRKTIKKGLQK